MKPNKYSIGQTVRVIVESPCKNLEGQVREIYWDEDEASNFYCIDTHWFPFAEKELQLVKQ